MSRELREKFLPTVAPRRKLSAAQSGDATFWPDVFVPSRMPWSSFLKSLVSHVVVLTAFLAWARWMPSQHITRQDPWTGANVILYPLKADSAQADLLKRDLPRLDTGSAAPHLAQLGDPAYARQPILSVPREPDNREQTLVTPPDIVLPRDVRLWNMVAWTTLPSAPAPALDGLAAQRIVKAPVLAVIAPPPEVEATHTHSLVLPQTAAVAPPPEFRDSASLRNQPALGTAVVPPPPQVESAARTLGTMDVGHADVIAPAPQLPVHEQRAWHEAANRQAAEAQLLSAAVVPPSPSISANETNASRRVIALSVHPAAPSEPVRLPAGNRRGEFSANPQGRVRGSGRPTITKSAQAVQRDSGTGGAPADSVLPAGIRVEEANAADSGNHAAAPALTVTAPRVTALPRKPATLAEHTPTVVERQVFGTRRFYSMMLNMPNLNSASGSWVLRFAELKAGPAQGELLSPLITRKSDPAYPSELQRANVQGTVTLYAVIHSDGSIREIRVLDGVDDQLDRYASEALGRCHFEPAIKNGAPVALEAVVMIPFRARRAY